MSEEEIKETELELEEENKDVPYEERYPLSDSSEYADYEDISGSSGASSEEEDEENEEEEEEEENKEPESDKGTTTSDEELIFELEKDEDSDGISSGELIEKPSDEEGEDKKEDKKEDNFWRGHLPHRASRAPSQHVRALARMSDDIGPLRPAGERKVFHDRHGHVAGAMSAQAAFAAPWASAAVPAETHAQDHGWSMVSCLPPLSEGSLQFFDC